MNNSDNTGNGRGQGGNFLSGFLVGAFVGAAVVFLLGTKKGKRLLKAISEDRSVDSGEVLEVKPKTRRFFRGISKHVN